MVKGTVVRLLLFGIPFGLSYWLARPTVSPARPQSFVVCAYPGDQPGELRISLEAAGCSRDPAPGKPQTASPVSVFPAVTTLETAPGGTGSEALNISF